ncbi:MULTISPECIES: acyltransferase [unclassified Arcicella]|uniref:acyltransferase family protein n=1 Tax=unclassified Arcicella TaxID=2644986 RepID=UPI00286420B6|nr:MULTISPECIES: acyltransferase [unclassified Arcicella]MDR6564797.1 peptidoglycan/LPS O-acetylase OafA/YrhL [Arcicella sp. BE51]MDR6814593.1 peptidoglycan/LPS O-acetylase OafA/YrhL [Arcicella sp. BE140]MDR6825971.1 peptidoglycan/LPS O-acetylase OafA/YrhL [Arcicella sp. BE139]
MKKRLDLIQVFRGLASMLVVLYHLVSTGEKYFSTKPFNGFFEFGWVGVDFFFVLSGFIIMFIHYGDIVNKGNWRLFLKKRAIRVYPIYWIVATITFAMYMILMHGNMRDEFIFNIHSIDHWIYLVKQYLLVYQETYFVSVAWSLTYEILFYLIFALCIFVGLRIAKYIVAIWIVMIALKSITHAPIFSSFVFAPGNYEFLLGCLVGYLFYKKQFISITKALISFSLILILFVIYLNYFDLTSNMLIAKLFFGSLSALIIWACASIDYQKVYNAAKIKLLVIIGDASYSLYLIHPIVLSTLCRVFAKIKFQTAFSSAINNMLFLIIFILTVLAGFLFHFFVEKKVLAYFSKK